MNPELLRAFDAYRAAVRESVNLEHAITERGIGAIPTAEEKAEVDRLDAAIAAAKAEVERLAPAPTVSGPTDPTALRQRAVQLAADAKALSAKNLASGKPLTRTMADDVRQALLEARSLADELPEDPFGVAALGALRQQLAAVDPSDAAEVAIWLSELARMARAAEGHAAINADPAVRALRNAISTDLTSGKPTTMTTSSLSGLWPEFRTYNFAARDVDLSPPFMETRALSTPGGSAIATTFADRVVEYQRTLNPMLNPAIVTFSTSSSGNPFRVPRLTADPALGGTVTAEAAAITQADPTISHVELTPYAYKAINLWSAELDEDEIIGLEPLIARSTAREIAVDAGAHLTTGDGNAKPNGIVTAAGNGGTASGTAAVGGEAFFGWPDLLTLMGQVAAPYRQNGAFMVSSDSFVKILGFRDTTGQPVLNPGLQSGVPTLFGKPVYENPAMAAAGSASKSVLFGDFSAYWVRRVTPIRIELSRDFRFSTDELALKTVDRLDGDLIDTAAVKYLVSADT